MPAVLDLSRIDELWKRLDIIIFTDPLPGSPADAELKVKVCAYCYDQAATAIRAAIDHLFAWRELLKAGVMPSYAHLSLLRTAHEAALLAYWLLEPGIDAQERRNRGIAAQAEDYNERKKFEDSAGRTTPAPGGKLAAERLSDVMAAAQQLGLVKVNKVGNDILTIQAPATVELFDMYEVAPAGAKGQFLYRLYSGYAHAKQWAIYQGAQQQTEFDDTGRTVALTQADDFLAMEATRRTVDVLHRALTAYENLRK